MERRKVYSIFKIVAVLVMLQLALYLTKSLIFIFEERTFYSDRMASMAAMVFLSIVFVIVSKKRGMSLSVFPKKHKMLYIILTIVFAVFLIWTFIINSSGDYTNVLQMIYGVVVTPVFEELIFRGYVWNSLNIIFNNKWKTYIMSSLLFGLWHIGYIDSIAFRVSGGLLNIMFWKVITGLCFGIVLGLLRIKSDNCYSTMLLHGFLNAFAR